MRWCTVLTLLTTLVGFPVSGLRQPLTERPRGGHDVGAIYRRLLPAPIKGKNLFILSTTRAATTCGIITAPSNAPADYAEAINDFKNANSQTYDLRSLLTDEGAKFISEQELKSFFGKGRSWAQFYQKHPDSAGYIAFSAIGFDKTRTLAAVYSEAVCDTLCGHGKMRFLKHDADGWSEVKAPFQLCDWIS